MRFLFLNQTFHPDVASTAQHLSDLALALIERGHEVTVVTSRRAYDNPKTLFSRRETWRGVRIHRIKSMGLGKESKWRRLLDCASFMILCLLRFPWLGRHDVVVALTSPPLISLVGLMAARLRRSSFVYWVMDLNPDEAVAAGWVKHDSFVCQVLERLSRLSLASADRIIALDQAMAARILNKGIRRDRVMVVPPWSHDPEVHFDEAGRNGFRQAHNLENKFVVMYSGNHSPCHPLDTLLEAADRLTNYPEILFCFVGGGTEFRRIQSRVAAHRGSANQNILCLPYQPLSKLADSLSAADAHVVVMGNGMQGIVHPCKIYNLLQLGAPIIYIGPASPIAQVVAETPISVSCSHGDVNGVVRSILNLSDGAARQKHEHYCASPEQYSKATIVPQMVKLLETARLDGQTLQNRPLAVSHIRR